jgi:hypothetical protein
VDNYDAWNLNNFSLEGLLFSLSPLKERSVAPSATFLLTAGGCENWRPSASTTPWIAIAWRPSGHLGRVYRLASRPDLFIYILLTVGRCILFLHLVYTCQHYLHKLTARGRFTARGRRRLFSLDQTIANLTAGGDDITYAYKAHLLLLWLLHSTPTSIPCCLTMPPQQGLVFLHSPFQTMLPGKVRVSFRAHCYNDVLSFALFDQEHHDQTTGLYGGNLAARGHLEGLFHDSAMKFSYHNQYCSLHSQSGTIHYTSNTLCITHVYPNTIFFFSLPLSLRNSTHFHWRRMSSYCCCMCSSACIFLCTE